MTPLPIPNLFAQPVLMSASEFVFMETMPLPMSLIKPGFTIKVNFEGGFPSKEFIVVGTVTASTMDFDPEPFSIWILTSDRRPSVGSNVEYSEDGKSIDGTMDYIKDRTCMLAGVGGGNGYFGKGFATDGSTGCERGLICDDPKYWRKPDHDYTFRSALAAAQIYFQNPLGEEPKDTGQWMRQWEWDKKVDEWRSAQKNVVQKVVIIKAVN